MMHIDPRPEPDIFNARVRVPGLKYLAANPRPTTGEFNNHSYWRRILQNLHDAYRGICAYSCHWIPYDTGADTVEHFLPKDIHPNQAYEWDNYRLVCATLNGRKGTFGDVLDPFHIEDGWFVLDFPSLQVKPADGLDDTLTAQVWATITRLKLNHDGTCLKARERYVKNYCKGCITMEFLWEEAPFIAYELERQGLVATINDIMGYNLDTCLLES
ncbi:MAG TPA: hypothetical protein VF546_12845 [Pyrinomonadaceae bacterium]|jgi:hypothetical protein